MSDHHAERERGFTAGLLAGLVEGGVSLPYVFFKYYHKLNISDAEAMLIMHLIAFREKDEKAFPTIEEIESRMTSDGKAVIRMLQRLTKEKLIHIEESVDPTSGMQLEKYSLTPLLMKLAAIISREEEQTVSVTAGNGRESAAAGAKNGGTKSGLPNTKQEDNLFYIFEQEFGRPLSPMEIDMINGWLDQDRYPKPLILVALKEAVFAGKVAFRYVDRILLDWNRNNIHTVEQAKEYTQKFRGIR